MKAGDDDAIGASRKVIAGRPPLQQLACHGATRRLRLGRFRLVQYDHESRSRTTLTKARDLFPQAVRKDARRHLRPQRDPQTRGEDGGTVHVLLGERGAEDVEAGDVDDGRRRLRYLGLMRPERLERRPAAAVGLDDQAVGHPAGPQGIDLSRRQAGHLTVRAVGAGHAGAASSGKGGLQSGESAGTASSEDRPGGGELREEHGRGGGHDHPAPGGDEVLREQE